jgi:two-component system LytT family sensor kinase
MKYSRIELGIATAFFIFIMFSAIQVGSAEYYWQVSNGRNGQWLYVGSLFPHLLITIAVFSGFLALNYYVLPKYLFAKKYVEAVGLTVGVFIVVGSAAMVYFSYKRDWEYDQHSLAKANLSFFSYGFVMTGAFLMVYALYVLVREIIIYQYKLSRVKQSISSRVTREVILVCSIWLAVLLPFCAIKGAGVFNIFGPFLIFVLPHCFALYFLNLYWLIPGYKKENPASGLVYFFKLVATAFVVGILEMAFLLQTYQFSFAGHLIFNWLLPSAVAIGVSWWVYWANEESYKELILLQTALGTTNANLQYLRSQINPHFLFNALNTLYGTALLEKADKTGDGIQKLGDMMRFMLHENNQDRIALSRELEYLHNYIDLQNMRLALSPDILIDIQIEDIIGYYEIAPMLLIPFVENAYKHGISHQAKSWINVNLYKKENTLHLDVYNSTHPVNENDPERFQSGTGLDNVKQRLQLLYPQKHELVVRQSPKEFFVHLSLILDTQKPA